MVEEFPSDPILKDIHFIRELMDIIGTRMNDVPSYRERGFIARNVSLTLYKHRTTPQHPEAYRHQPH